MSQKPRGKAVIMNNNKFNKSAERSGSDCDVSNLKNLFKELSFIVSSHTDKTAEVKHIMEMFIKALIYFLFFNRI